MISARRCETAPSPWRVLEPLLVAQHGVVTRDQVLAAGFTPGGIAHALRLGRLHRLHRGVYFAGHPDAGAHPAEMAAVLACGHGTAVSHWSALSLAGFGGSPLEGVHVIRAVANPGPRSGLIVHRTARLPRSDVIHRDGIPMTTPLRTIADLATHLDADDLEALIGEGLARDLFTQTAVRSLPRRRGLTSRGRANLAVVLAPGEPPLTRSEAERRMLALIRRAGLPLPRCNARLHGFEVDMLWAEARLVVEIDGFAAHGRRANFESDRARDVEVGEKGYAVLRFTWRQIVERPEWVAAKLAARLLVAV